MKQCHNCGEDAGSVYRCDNCGADLAAADEGGVGR